MLYQKLILVLVVNFCGKFLSHGLELPKRDSMKGVGTQDFEEEWIKHLMEDDNDDTPIYISIDGKIEELKLPRKLSEAEKEIILQGTKQSRETKTFHLDTKAIEDSLRDYSNKIRSKRDVQHEQRRKTQKTPKRKLSPAMLARIKQREDYLKRKLKKLQEKKENILRRGKIYGNKFEKQRSARLSRVVKEKTRLQIILNRYRAIQIKNNQSWKDKKLKQMVNKSSKQESSHFKRRRHVLVNSKLSKQTKSPTPTNTPLTKLDLTTAKPAVTVGETNKLKASHTSKNKHGITLKEKTNSTNISDVNDLEKKQKISTDVEYEIFKYNTNKSVEKTGSNIKQPETDNTLTKPSKNHFKKEPRGKMNSLSVATKQIIKTIVPPKHIPLLPKLIVTKTEVSPPKAIINKQEKEINKYSKTKKVNSVTSETSRMGKDHSIKVDTEIRIKSRPVVKPRLVHEEHIKEMPTKTASVSGSIITNSPTLTPTSLSPVHDSTNHNLQQTSFVSFVPIHTSSTRAQFLGMDVTKKLKLNNSILSKATATRKTTTKYMISHPHESTKSRSLKYRTTSPVRATKTSKPPTPKEKNNYTIIKPLPLTTSISPFEISSKFPTKTSTDSFPSTLKSKQDSAVTRKTAHSTEGEATAKEDILESAEESFNDFTTSLDATAWATVSTDYPVYPITGDGSPTTAEHFADRATDGTSNGKFMDTTTSETTMGNFTDINTDETETDVGKSTEATIPEIEAGSRNFTEGYFVNASETTPEYYTKISVSNVSETNLTERPIKTAVIELLVIVDHRLYYDALQKYRFNSLLASFSLKKYYNLIVKLVDQRFAAIEDHEYIFRVKKAAIYIAMSRMEAQWLEGIKVYSDKLQFYQVDPWKALARVKDWLLKKHDSLGRYDHAMVFTEYSLVKADGSSNIGMAYISSICQIQWGFSLSIVQEQGGFASVGTAAHELGHSLGAPHDGTKNAKSCPADRNFLMTPSTQISPEKQKNFYMFSNCSVEFFKRMMRRPRASCLFDSTPPTERRDKWPGQMMDADSQCRYVHGPRTGLCGVKVLRDQMCGRLWCKIPEDPVRCMSSIQVMAVYGTSCGDKMMCIEGECKHHPDAPKDTKCMFGDKMQSFCDNIVRKAPQHWCKIETIRYKCCQTCLPYTMVLRS